MAEWIQGRILERLDWTDTHFSLRLEADLPPFQAGQFIRLGLDIGGERVARPYSLVNAPGESPLEIYLNIVPGGPLSGALSGLSPGSVIWLGPRAMGFLTLDEVPASARDLWMLATGTGIGPFLSMLKTEDIWQRFDRVILVHSVRFANQLVYKDLVDSLLAAHPEQLAYLPIVTGEAIENCLCERIPTAIESGLLEQRTGLPLSADKSHVMACGNAGMIKDALSVLEKRQMKKHLRHAPGHITTEKYH